MRQLATLAWKEWHEVRAFLWIALGVFVGLPIIGGLEAGIHIPHGFQIDASLWVQTLGGVLAIFVGVGAVCRDFGGRLEDFWRSRPVGASKWLLIKYLVGLCVVLAACLLPMLLELAIDRDTGIIVFIVEMPLVWAALYSIGFLSGCLLRRTAHAAMLALAAMLLLYFLPVLLPPLGWLNIAQLADRSLSPSATDFGAGEIAFAGGMAGIALGSLALALAAVHRGWHLESGRRTMYGSISAAILILFSSAAFQLGTDMPILQQVDLPAGEFVTMICMVENHGFVITEKDEQWRTPGTEKLNYIYYMYRPLDLTPAGLELGEGHQVNWGYPFGAYSTSNPEIRYSGDEVRNGNYITCLLAIYDLSQNRNPVELPLWEFYDLEDDPSESSQVVGEWKIGATYVWQNRLYVWGTHLITMDINDPRGPKVISDRPNPQFFAEHEGFLPMRENGKLREIALPQIPELPAAERLRMVTESIPGAFDGKVLCTVDSSTPTQQWGAFQLIKLTDQAATFKLVGDYQQTMLERIFGFREFWWMKMHDGLIYTNWRSGYGRNGPINSSISVFDIRGPRVFREVGHFAAPGVGLAWPLPDGRCIVGGSKLWLVGPPPRAGGD